MFAYRQSILLVALLGCAIPAARAERRRANQPGEEFATAADQMFREFFGETEADREALQKIEISVRQEREIGEAGLQSFLRSLDERRIRVVTRGKDVDYLKSLVAEIRPLMRNSKRYPTIRVHVAETPETDARAFPGGAIVCTSGMIDFAQSEAALVGVLAHELSHIDRGHQLRMARSIRRAETTWASGRTRPDEGMRSMMQFGMQFARPFRPEDEAEADRDAARWAFELRYDPMEMAELFRRLDRRQPQDDMHMPSFLRTHPYNAERYAAVKEFARRLQGGKHQARLYVGEANLERRIPRSDQRFER